MCLSIYLSIDLSIYIYCYLSCCLIIFYLIILLYILLYILVSYYISYYISYYLIIYLIIYLSILLYILLYILLSYYIYYYISYYLIILLSYYIIYLSIYLSMCLYMCVCTCMYMYISSISYSVTKPRHLGKNGRIWCSPDHAEDEILHQGFTRFTRYFSTWMNKVGPPNVWSKLDIANQNDTDILVKLLRNYANYRLWWISIDHWAYKPTHITTFKNPKHHSWEFSQPQRRPVVKVFLFIKNN